MRAIRNFSIFGVPINHLPQLIRALAIVKKAAVLATAKLGDISADKAGAICAACNDIARGGLTDQFPIDVFQGGAGTSTNMNINEVIANRSLEHWDLLVAATTSSIQMTMSIFPSLQMTSIQLRPD